MNLILSADLACPPSEHYAFRSVCLFASIKDYVIFAEVSDWEFRDTYFYWFKRFYLFDFVKDLVKPAEVQGIEIQVDRIVCENASHIAFSL